MSTTTSPRHRELEADGLVVVGMAAGVLISLVVHFVGLPLLMALLQLLDLLQPPQMAALPPPPAEVEVVAFEEPEPEPPEPEPEVVTPEPEPEPEAPPPPREPPPTRRDEPPPPPPAPGPPPRAEEPPPEEPLDLTGLTLTSESGSFAVAAGDGTEREGPIGPPPARTVVRGTPDGVEGGTGGGGPPEGTGPAVVAFRDLSRRPEQPSDLGERLTRFYPPVARAQGIDGQAFVRFRIDPDGSLSNIRTISESPEGYGFAARCVEMLRGVRFSPPIDRNGNAVATLVGRFPCAFRVRN